MTLITNSLIDHAIIIFDSVTNLIFEFMSLPWNMLQIFEFMSLPWNMLAMAGHASDAHPMMLI